MSLVIRMTSFEHYYFPLLAERNLAKIYLLRTEAGVIIMITTTTTTTTATITIIKIIIKKTQLKSKNKEHNGRICESL